MKATPLFAAGALATMASAPLLAALRADWNPSTEPLGTTFGGDAVWDDVSGTLGDQWNPLTAPEVIVRPSPPAGTANVDTGSGLAVLCNGSDHLEMATFGGTPVFAPAIDTGDASVVLLAAPASLTSGRQVLFESGGTDGLSVVLIDSLLTLTVSQVNGTGITMQATVDLTGIWAHPAAFLRITACVDQYPRTGERAAITLDVTNGTNRADASDTTNDANFTSWCGGGLSGLGRQSGGIGGDLGGVVTNLSAGGAFGTFDGVIGRVLVYDNSLCAPPLDPTVTRADKYWWSSSAGWINCGASASTVNGLVVGEMFCTGWVWSSNTGWICLGDGSPLDGIRYSNSGGEDFGVNVIEGHLEGYAWAPTFGWVNFGLNYPPGPDLDVPSVDLLTGKTRGYAWSPNIGWINLGEGFAGAVTDAFAFFDTDGDGISDAWERNRLAAAGMADDLTLVGGADADGDLRSDSDEFNEDSDPFDPGDRFQIVDLLPDTPAAGMTTVDWTSKPSRIYQVFIGDDLTDFNSWTQHGADAVGDPSGTSSAPTPLDPAVKPRDFVRVGARRPLVP